MEWARFIDSKTLNEYATDNSLSYKSALDVAIQIASALDEAHQAGIIHRDIKPDNIMIRSNGLVKILDFGIAKLTEKQDLDIESEDATTIQSGTMPGMIIGTANYMSPEQAKGEVVDARSDIFSFGVVLYEMMAGKLPFAGDSAMEMIGAILHKEPKPLDADIPVEIGKIIDKCLIKDRNKRYQTIKSVLADLKHWQITQLIENELQSTSASFRKTDAETQIFKVATDADAQTTQITENS